MTEYVSPEAGNIVYLAGALGFNIHNEQNGALAITGKDGKPTVALPQLQSDGLYLSSVTMPNGKNEKQYWRQTDLTISPTGVQFMAYERVEQDGKTIHLEHGRPQALLQAVGTLVTEEDVKVFKDMVHGNFHQAMFDTAEQNIEKWKKNADARSAKTGLKMPEVFMTSDKEGALVVPAMTHKLQELGLDAPKLTVELSPLGAGAGLRHVAEQKAEKDSHNKPKTESVLAIGRKLAENVISGHSPSWFFDVPGGVRKYADAKVGRTFEYDSDSPNSMKLDIPARKLSQQGYTALRWTPEKDTPTDKILTDNSNLSPDVQWRAEVQERLWDGLGKAASYGKYYLQKGESHLPHGNKEDTGLIHNASIDLHMASDVLVAPESHTLVPNKATRLPHHEMKSHTHTQPPAGKASAATTGTKSNGTTSARKRAAEQTPQ